MELIEEEGPYEIENEIQRKRMQETIKTIIEIGKWYHYLAKEGDTDDGQTTITKPMRENMGSRRVM